MRFHLDPVGGVAGDMFVAAMLDAFPDLAGPLSDALSQVKLLSGVECRLVLHRDHVLAGSRFNVEKQQLQTDGESDKLTHRGASHAHGSSFRHIRTDLTASGLTQDVKSRAIAIFEVLADAEARVHGVDIEDVIFHEVGNWDSIADIVAASFLIDAVGASSWSIGPLPLGSGHVDSAHGLLPVPAPAVVLLLEGFEVYDDGIPGERVTPTGAAIIRHLDCEKQIGRVPRTLTNSGIGFGTRAFENSSNILRLLAFTEGPTEHQIRDKVAVLAFEIDDQTGEDLAAGLARLRMHPGVIQITQTPGFGKKGRMLAHVQILARPDCWEDVGNLCFLETSTLGVRCQVTSRLTLRRETAKAEIDGREVRVKTAYRPDGTLSAKAEMDDLDQADSGRAGRESIRQAAERSVVQRGDDERR